MLLTLTRIEGAGAEQIGHFDAARQPKGLNGSYEVGFDDVPERQD